MILAQVDGPGAQGTTVVRHRLEISVGSPIFAPPIPGPKHTTRHANSHPPSEKGQERPAVLPLGGGRFPRTSRRKVQIGAYDPNQNPAFIEINDEKALSWLQKGAQPSDTCRAILSYTGIVYKNHLAGGVKKGAFDQAEADRRFDIWKNEKTAKIEGKKNKLAQGADAAQKARIDAENKKAADKAAALSAKLAAAAAVEAPAAEAPAEGEAPAEAAAE